VRNKTKIKLVLVDNHVLFRKGLKAILSDYSDFEVIGDFSNLHESLPLIQFGNIDILIIDTDFSKFSSKELKINEPGREKSTKVLALTLENSPIQNLNVITSGVDGYLLKDEEIEDLITNLKKIFEGKFVLSEKLNKNLVDLIQEKMNFPFHYILSEREFDVLRLVQDGLTNKEISQNLFLSENTVKTHLKHIFKKLSVKNRKDAIAKAKMWGIFK